MAIDRSPYGWVFGLVWVGLALVGTSAGSATFDLPPALDEALAPFENAVVLAMWEESAHNGRGPVVSGYHVAVDDGMRTLEFYLDDRGQLLGDEYLT
ncbi:MAG TPA: hypothetical protein ENN80_08170, partial [Candidatus Hydrogenedentes bacterium]|nr:hypothetical protein [Candidatus Hydrogenedentota bacterium]